VFDFQRVNQCASLHTKNRIDFPRCLNARDARAFCEGRLKYSIGLHLARQYWWGVKGIYCIIYVPKYDADRGCRNRVTDENVFCVFKSCQFILFPSYRLNNYFKEILSYNIVVDMR